jgi:transposase
MEAIIAQNVGVDISKATLDVHLHPAGSARQFTNDAHGIKALLGWLADHTIARIVFEPTGPYHHRLERQLGEAGLPLAKVNPRYRPGALPRLPAPMPRPMPSMPSCSPAWARC